MAELAEQEATEVRALLKSKGVKPAARLLGVCGPTLLKASVPVPVHRHTVLVIREKLGALSNNETPNEAN